mmetsp:Transcript_89636/g.171803  ORF Transcript_89636/g.171803 Transcript_89636/m.171803 type:complete len:109 (+) Transcript_89636:438-764(+)
MGIKDAEADQSLASWLRREDVTSKITLPFQMEHETENHTTIAMMEGCTRLRRSVELGRKDNLEISLQIQVKVLFVNRYLANQVENDEELRKLMTEAPNKLNLNILAIE